MLLKLKALKAVDVISPEGRLDGASVGAFEQALHGLAERNRRKIVVDCSKLDYVSSAGLRALVSALKDCRRAGGGIVLVHVSERVADTLGLVGFNSLFDRYDDILDAVDSF